MTNQTLTLMRMILLVLIVLSLGLTGYIYFQTTRFNFAGLLVAIGCLVVFLVTGKQSSGK